MHDIYTLSELNLSFVLLALSHLFGDFITPFADAQTQTSAMLLIVRFGVDFVGTFGSIGG